MYELFGHEAHSVPGCCGIHTIHISPRDADKFEGFLAKYDETKPSGVYRLNNHYRAASLLHLDGKEPQSFRDMLAEFGFINFLTIGKTTYWSGPCKKNREERK